MPDQHAEGVSLAAPDLGGNAAHAADTPSGFSVESVVSVATTRMGRTNRNDQDVMTGTPMREPATTQVRAYDRLPRRTPRLLRVPRLSAPELSAPTLTLVTLQSREAYETLQRDGVLRCASHPSDPDFREAYGWMASQMRRRLPTAGDGILWAWARTKRAAVVHHARHARGQVLLTVQVSRDRVLVSDYLDWHQVLNRCVNIVPLPGESDVEWERRFDVEWDAWHERTRPYEGMPIDQWPTDLRAEIETSWETIFDLDAVSVDRPLQAALHTLTVEDVVRAVRIA